MSSWVFLAVIFAAIVPVITLIMSQVAEPKGNSIWAKIAMILGRIFSLSTFQDASGKANASLPIVGNPKPKSER